MTGDDARTFELLRAIRAAGWSVAVHNDYKQGGFACTFWGFTKGNEWVKGEGMTDWAALTSVAIVAGVLTAVNASGQPPLGYTECSNRCGRWKPDELQWCTTCFTNGARTAMLDGRRDWTPPAERSATPQEGSAK